MEELIIYLVLSNLCLLSGPIAYASCGKHQAAVRILDYIVIISLLALVTLLLIPEFYHNIGLWIGVPIILGAISPFVIERYSQRHFARNILLAFVGAGMVLHALFDGIAISLPSLSYAVLLHRLAVGLIIWRMFKEHRLFAWLVYAGITLTTTIGFYLGMNLIQLLSHQQTVIFEAFYIGFLLHVVVDVLYDKHHSH